MTERNGVGTDAEFRAPLFGDDFREAVDAGFGETVVSLASVSVDAGGRGDVDDAPRSAVGDAEEGGCFAD